VNPSDTTTRRLLLAALLATLLLASAALAVAATASGYSLNWFTVDGGGGASSGGRYAVSATIGQPDAGTLTGGSYTLNGGFWGGAAASYGIYLPLAVR
jgi:hypothetical protein